MLPLVNVCRLQSQCSTECAVALGASLGTSVHCCVLMCKYACFVWAPVHVAPTTTPGAILWATILRQNHQAEQHCRAFPSGAVWAFEAFQCGGTMCVNSYPVAASVLSNRQATSCLYLVAKLQFRGELHCKAVSAMTCCAGITEQSRKTSGAAQQRQHVYTS